MTNGRVPVSNVPGGLLLPCLNQGLRSEQGMTGAAVSFDYERCLQKHRQ